MGPASRPDTPAVSGRGLCEQLIRALLEMREGGFTQGGQPSLLTRGIASAWLRWTAGRRGSPRNSSFSGLMSAVSSCPIRYSQDAV